MRSLWRVLALQWLGADGSKALTGESAILDGVLGERHPRDAFSVRRDSQVSRHALMVTDPAPGLDPGNTAEEALSSESPGHSS